MRLGWFFSAALLTAAPLTTLGAVPERDGPYLGIQPGTRDVAPGKVRIQRRGGRAVMTWVGFQMLGTGGGRVFIQTNKPAQYTVVPSAPDEVVLDFEHTRLHRKNDGRKLDTTFFPSAVDWIDADRRGHTTRVTIHLRERVAYDLRQEGKYLFLDFRPTLAATEAATPTP